MYDFEDAISFLEQDYFELQLTLKRVNLSTKSEMQTVRNYCIHSYNEIIQEKDRIKCFLEAWCSKENMSSSIQEMTEIDLQASYFRGVCNLIDDALWELLRYLIAYFPEDCSSEFFIEKVQNLAPAGDPIAIKFLEGNTPVFLRLKQGLSSNGFFDLEKTRILTEEQKNELIRELINKGIPFSIAMFDFLGYLTYLRNRLHTYSEGARLIQKLFSPGKDLEGKNVERNINSLEKYNSKAPSYNQKGPAKDFYLQLLK
jgi:hypothetical protein